MEKVKIISQSPYEMTLEREGKKIHCVNVQRRVWEIRDGKTGLAVAVRTSRIEAEKKARELLV